MFGLFSFGEGLFGQPDKTGKEEPVIIESPACDWPTLVKLLKLDKPRKGKARPAPVRPPAITGSARLVQKPATRTARGIQENEEEIARALLAAMDLADEADMQEAARQAAIHATRSEILAREVELTRLQYQLEALESGNVRFNEVEPLAEDVAAT